MSLEILIKGVFFESSQTAIEWNAPFGGLILLPQTTCTESHNRTDLTWQNETLLGINGDWTASWFPHEKRKRLRSVYLSKQGAKEADYAMSLWRKQLFSLLGPPELSSTPSNNLWAHGKVYVQLSLFEADDVYCTLAIGIR